MSDNRDRQVLAHLCGGDAPDSPKRDDYQPFDTNCPDCGAELTMGYGMAFGGCGPYAHCEADGCEFFYKVQDPE